MGDYIRFSPEGLHGVGSDERIRHLAEELQQLSSGIYWRQIMWMVF